MAIMRQGLPGGAAVGRDLRRGSRRPPGALVPGLECSRRLQWPETEGPPIEVSDRDPDRRGGCMSGSPVWRALLLAVTAFNALSAVAGGAALILLDGLGMPKSWLAGTPLT